MKTETINYYEEIREIRNKTLYPDGVPLEFGCGVFTKYTHKVILEYDPDDKEFLSVGDSEYWTSAKEITEIQGKPVSLNDVLILLGLSEEGCEYLPTISIAGEKGWPRIIELYLYEGYDKEGEQIGFPIDLEKDIEDQTTETLERIYNLIKGL